MELNQEPNQASNQEATPESNLEQNQEQNQETQEKNQIDPTTDNLCAACGIRARNIEENSLSVLCDECKDEYLRFSAPSWIYLFFAAVIATVLLASLRMPEAIGMYKIYLQAEKSKSEKLYSDALDNYYTVIERYGGSTTIIMNAMDSAMRAQAFDAAAYILDNHLADRELNDSDYSKASDMVYILERYYETTERCNAIFADNQDVDKIVDELLTLSYEGGMDKAYIYFMLGNITHDAEQSLNYFELACRQDARLTYPLAHYGNALRRSGDLETSIEIYQKALQSNANDAFALRGIGVVRLLQGDMTDGLEKIQLAYEMNPNGIFMAESMIIALCENGRRDEATVLLKEKESEDYLFEADIFAYLDGEISLKNYFGE